MKRKKREPEVHSERWLVSYADFITLLFAFFVVLYASSQVDHARMSALGNAIQHAFQELGVMQDRGLSPSTPPANSRRPAELTPDDEVEATRPICRA